MNNLKFENFTFDVSEQLFNIPHKEIEEVRLLVVDQATGAIRHDMFTNLAEHLRDDDEIVMNNVGIARSRLSGPVAGGPAVDVCFLLLDPREANVWEVVVLAEEFPPFDGEVSLAGGSVKAELLGQIAPFDGAYWIERGRYQGYRGRARIDVSPARLRAVLEEHGSYMHPWYTNLNELPEHILNPQTATLKQGALLSEPSRRFDPELLARCTDDGARLTLVSIDMAFAWRPAAGEDTLDDFSMNSEHICVSETAAQKIQGAVSERRRLITVGTGPTRVLESMPLPPTPMDTLTDLFISPGYTFKYSGGLLTNLHVPMSTHVIMASAFGGRELVVRACQEAAERGYHFGIHGDSMLVLGNHVPLAYRG